MSGQKLPAGLFRSQKACQRRSRCSINVRAASLPHRRAADLAIKKYIQSGQIVGLGSGPLCAAITEGLADALSSKELQRVICIPASDAAAAEAAVNGVPLTDLHNHPQVDVLCCDVDRIDAATLAFIVGCLGPGNMHNQPQLPRFQRLVSASKMIIAMADEHEKVVSRLCGAVPVTIDADNWEKPSEDIDDIFLGDAEIWRRSSTGSSDPRGGSFPYLSPEGHNILDIQFYEDVKLYGKAVPYEEIAAEIEGVEGVVAHGLVTRAADVAIVATASEAQVLMPMRQLLNKQLVSDESMSGPWTAPVDVGTMRLKRV